MKIERKNGSDARLVLLRMIIDDAVLGAISAKWDGKNFASPMENRFGGWAVEHWKKFRKAPGRHIANYYDRWADHANDADADFAGILLEAISDEYKRNGTAVAANVALEAAQLVFDKVRCDALRESIGSALEAGDVDRAKAEIAKFKPAAVSQEMGHDVYAGGAVARNAIESGTKPPLIKWDQEALAKFFDWYLAPGEFIVFRGPAKRGKSFWLQEVTYQGVRCGNNVAYFLLGDQTRDQIYRRLIARAANRPVRADRAVKIPMSIIPSPDGKMPEIEYKVKEFKNDIEGRAGSLALKEIGNKYGMDRLKLSVHRARSINITGIEAKIDDWVRDGWFPRIVVLDYPDLLAPIDGRQDSRHQINETWMMIRGLCEKLDCLMVVADQSDAQGYDRQALDMGNFAESRTKNDHPTGLININQTKDEKDKGLYRLAWQFARDMEYGPTTEVYTAGCLAMANPAVLSCFA